jgi:predicted transcriptional regulator
MEQVNPLAAQLKKYLMKSAKLNNIETRIVDALWYLERASSHQIAEKMQGKPCAFSTLSFALRMLSMKGIIGHAKLGGKYYYFPLQQRSELICSEIAELIQKHFKGDIPSFNQFFDQNVQLIRDCDSLDYSQVG